ncbi:hypothetical protein CLOM_g6903 [Closterium sp. NIES-68]|nr:hypothetical protein CLOM_g6903 [Closterium sp. NIES-68]
MAHDVRKLASSPAVVLLLVASHLVSSCSAFRFKAPEPLKGPVRINCGSSERLTVHGHTWLPDSFYHHGTPFHIPRHRYSPSPNLPSAPRLSSPIETTLRAFPNVNSNGGCYTVPLVPETRYLVRVGVAYRNYDGQNRPPAFHMAVNGLIIKTVAMGVTEKQYPLSAYYSEYIVFARQGYISVCFMPLLGVVAAPPQVNSLEFLPIDPLAYDALVTGTDVVVVPLLRHDLGARGGAGDGGEGGMGEGGWAAEDSAFRVWGQDLAPAWGAVSGRVAQHSSAVAAPTAAAPSARTSDSSTSWSTRGHQFAVVTTSKRIEGADVAPDYIPSALFQSAWAGAEEARGGGEEQGQGRSQRARVLLCWPNDDSRRGNSSSGLSDNSSSSSVGPQTCVGSVGFTVRLDPVNLLDVLCVRLFFAEVEDGVGVGDRRFDIRLGAMSVLGRVREEERAGGDGGTERDEGERASTGGFSKGFSGGSVKGAQVTFEASGGRERWKRRGEKLQKLSARRNMSARTVDAEGHAEREGGAVEGEGVEEGTEGQEMVVGEEARGRRKLLGKREGNAASRGSEKETGGSQNKEKRHSSWAWRRKGENARERARRSRRVGVEHIAHTGLDKRQAVVHGSVLLDALKSVSESGEFDTGGGVGTPVNWYRNFLDFSLRELVFGKQPRPWRQERQQLLQWKHMQQQQQALGHWEQQQQQGKEKPEEEEQMFPGSNPVYARDWSSTGFDILAAAGGVPHRAIMVPLYFNFTLYAEEYGPELVILLKPMRGSKRPPLLAGVEVVEVVRTPEGGHVPAGYLPNDIAAVIVLVSLAYIALKLAPLCRDPASHSPLVRLPFVRLLSGPTKDRSS